MMDCDRAFENDRQQIAYENAINCIYLGLPRRVWVNCGARDPDLIWAKALERMGFNSASYEHYLLRMMQK